MKTFFRTIKKLDLHVRLGSIAHGLVMLVAGIVMPRDGRPIIIGGAVFTAVALILVIGSMMVDEIIEGEIVDRQQPQLTDVQVHTHRAHELSQVA
jgi:hypothetical protein